MKNNFNKLKFFWQVAAAHTIAVFITGLSTLIIVDYRDLAADAVLYFTLHDRAALAAIGPALQLFCGLIFALVLLPLRKALFEERRGLLKLGLLTVVLSTLLSAFAFADTGSLIGYIHHAEIQIKHRILVYFEAVLYAALFIGMLAFAKKYPKSKAVAVTPIVAISLICLTSAWLLAASAAPSQATGGVSGDMVDFRDGRVYKTVKIGKQTWMAEDLNYKTEGYTSRCHEESYCAAYGRLYDWGTAMTVCPIGWHLPRSVEWDALVRAAGGKKVAGITLKSKTGWPWEEDGGGTDEFGFSAMPNHSEAKWGAWFFNAGRGDDGKAYCRIIDSGSSEVEKRCLDKDKITQLSVRCVEDADKGGAKAASKKSEPPVSPIADARDGQEYRTVKIGTQVWMAENLNFHADSSWCYNDSDVSCKTYGRLYSWNAAVAACPAGWHLPDTAEWQTLFVAVGGARRYERFRLYDFAGRMLKSKAGWKDWYYTNGDGIDKFGFSALPGGYRMGCVFGTDSSLCSEYDHYHFIGEIGAYWSATEEQYYQSIDHSTGDVGAVVVGSGFRNEKGRALSVRCLRD